MRLSSASAIIAAGAIAATGAAAQHQGHGDGGRPFTVAMTGAAERPGPGDPDGSGTARIMVNAGQGRVCWDVTVSNIDPATAAHIHRGPATASGPPVVTMTPPTGHGCADVDRALAQELIQNPGGFYVNVHNAAFPPGAIRGQLGR
jgi:hypothetical protein